MEQPFWIVVCARRHINGQWVPYSTPAMTSYVAAKVAAEMHEHQRNQYSDVNIIGPMYVTLPKEK